MHPGLKLLQPYPFERLRALFADHPPPADKSPILLSIGEPRHPPPKLVVDELVGHLHGLANYPLTKGSAALREAITAWLTRRYGLSAAGLDPERQVLPVNGTREALFAFAQAVLDPAGNSLVVMPNPFYQIYEGAALLGGARPWFYNLTRDNGYKPDWDAIPAGVWRRCRLVYVCTPGNPAGAVLSDAELGRLIELADEHDFLIASDECYAEIHFDEATPPGGLLGACARIGRDDYRRCVIFHSLSKRSNLPGLRSGFVAGDAEVLAGFLRYRTYHGCAMPPPVQAASITAWNDEAHVLANRQLYREKLDTVLEILAPVLDVERPEAAFYLWARTPGSDTDFARALHASENVSVLPGSYLSRDTEHGNPGAGHVRMALVAEPQECSEAAWRIRRFIETR